MKRILVLSDIHGNWPALRATAAEAAAASFDLIINCGDSTVYAPFADQVLDWLRQEQVMSILGNTDSKVVKLLKGKEFHKPGSREKRIMYTHTAETLSKDNQQFLLSLKKKGSVRIGTRRIAFFHGSPAKHTEFLFPGTQKKRFQELARTAEADIILTGHTHLPLHKIVNNVHFFNPGSVGRMFDGQPTASYLVLELDGKQIQAQFRRCAYAVEEVAAKLQQAGLPEMYQEMFRQGRKLN